MSQKPCGCPVVTAEQWEGQQFNWKDKTFFQEKVNYLFKAPLNVEGKVQVAAEAIEKRGYMLEEPLMILMQEGTFSGAVLVAILPPDAKDPQVVTFGESTVCSTVFELNDAKIGPGVKDFRAKLQAQGKRVKNVYLWHVTCPNCTQIEGFKTVIFAELDQKQF